MDAAARIRDLSAQGHDAQAIALQLVEAGIRPKHGVWSAVLVENVLRLFGEAPVARAMTLTGMAAPAAKLATDMDAGRKSERHAEWRKKRSEQQKRTRGKNFSEAQKAEITRLYLVENMKLLDICKQLKVNYRQLAPFCAYLAGFTAPPGEITEYIDKEGRKITKYPPGYAFGANPQRNVGMSQGSSS